MRVKMPESLQGYQERRQQQQSTTDAVASATLKIDKGQSVEAGRATRCGAIPVVSQFEFPQWGKADVAGQATALRPREFAPAPLSETARPL